MFKLGFSTIGCPDYDIEQIIDLATANRFEGVELRFVRGTTDLGSLEEFSAENLPTTTRRFDDAGIVVVAIDTSVRMNSLDPGVRREQIELTKLNLVIAEALGAKYLRVFGGENPKGQSKRGTRTAIVDGLSEVAELTHASGVMSLLGTHDSFSTSDEILALFDEGASTKLGVLWDTLHTYRYGEDAQDTWNKLGSRVHHVHVKDSTVASPDEFDFALTGKGIVPIPHIVDVLRSRSFSEFVDFEWEKGWHPDIAEPQIAIPHFSRYMSSLLR